MTASYDRRAVTDGPSVTTTRPAGVTVVLPTWNRPEGLRRALDGLSAQEPPWLDGNAVDWDVVVVASAADPHAGRVVDSIAASFSVPIQVVVEPLPGASRARNRGLMSSRAVTAFLDDDCVPADGWLASISAPVLSGAAAAAGGRVLPDPSVPVPGWLGDALLDFLARYDRGPAPFDLAPDDYLLTANAAFDAGILSGAGGFDPLLGPSAGRPTVDDDVDVCRKVVRAGGHIRYVPSAVVVHELPASRLTPGYLLRRMYAQGVSDWLLDRGTLAASPGRGLAPATSRLARELSTILRQGPWHRSVLLHAAGSAARAAGFARQAASGPPADHAK